MGENKDFRIKTNLSRLHTLHFIVKQFVLSHRISEENEMHLEENKSN